MKHIMILLLALALGPGCDAEMPQSTVQFETCHRVQIIDSQTGKPVRGLEDMAVTENGQWVLASAYDRWSTEDAAQTSATALPQGGLYLIPLDQIALSGTHLRLNNIADKYAQTQDFHPHGIDIYTDDRGQQTIAVINRRYAHKSGASSWDLETTLEVFTLEDQILHHKTTVASDQLCRTNDILALSTDVFLASRDHGTCAGIGLIAEDVFGLDRSRILQISLGDQTTTAPQIRLAADGIAFANGLALDKRSSIVYVAATRGEHILTYRLKDLLTSEMAVPLAKTETKAGPDNLSWGPSGHLVAALHPSLWRLGLYRNRWLGRSRSPSEITSFNLSDHTQTTLYRDASGDQFSAATIGIQTDNLLLLGSVAESGVMVCVKQAAQNGET